MKPAELWGDVGVPVQWHQVGGLLGRQWRETARSALRQHMEAIR